MMRAARTIILGFGLAAVSSAGTARGGLPFHCTVRNSAMLKGGVTQSQVCDEIKLAVERQLRIAVEPLLQFERVDRARSNWLKIEVALDASGEAIAQIAQKRNGRVRTLPPIAVSMSDKRMDIRTIKQLAQQVALASSK